MGEPVFHGKDDLKLLAKVLKFMKQEERPRGIAITGRPVDCRMERRLMAPVSHDTLGLDSPDSSSALVHDACVVSVLIMGLLLLVFLCLRCFRKKPKRDSFGFLPNSRRPSLTQAELMV